VISLRSTADWPTELCASTTSLPGRQASIRPTADAVHSSCTQPNTAVAFKPVETVARFHEVTGALGRATIDQRLLSDTRQTGMKVLWYQLLLNKCHTPLSSHVNLHKYNSILWIQQPHHPTRPPLTLRLATDPCVDTVRNSFKQVLKVESKLLHNSSSSPGRVKNFLVSTSSRLVLGRTQPPTQWVPGALSPGVKRPGREADHLP
jgi:hypothetical protein